MGTKLRDGWHTCTCAHTQMQTQKKNYTLQILKNGLSLQWAGRVTQFRVTQMWQEKDFHFCLLISQQGFCGPPSHPSLSSPNPNILHEKEPQIKSLQSSHQIPVTLVLLSGGNWLTGLLTSFSFWSRHLFTQTCRRRPSSRDCNIQAWCNGGENAIFPCSCFARGTKTLLPYIHFCILAPLQSQAKQACKNSSATESKWRNINGHKLCIYQTCMHLFKCADTKENIRALCVYAPVECAHKSSSLLMCREEMQAAHPFVLWHFIWPLPCLYVFANCLCLFSDILRDRRRLVLERATGTQEEIEREAGSEKCKSFFFSISVSKWGNCTVQLNRQTERLTYVSELFQQTTHSLAHI